MVGAGQGWVGMHPPELAWWTGGQGGGAGSGGGARASVPGGSVVETRVPGTEQISQRVSYFCRF